MGCFSTCFGTDKPCRRRRRRPVRPKPSLLDHLQKYESVDDFKVPQMVEEEEEEVEKEEVDEPIEDNLSSDSNSEEKREKANLSERKKVTFDLNVQVYEHLPREEEEVYGDTRESIEDGEEETQIKSQCSSDSNSSSLFSYPLNHRYQNCTSDDEVDEELSSDESDIDDYYTDDEYDDDDEVVESAVKDEKVVMAQDQSSESLFSLSIDSRRQNLRTDVGDKEVNSPMPDKNAPLKDSSSRYDWSKCVDSVLNPVENLTQWKVIKARSREATKDQAKENQNSVNEFSFPAKKEALQREIAVDTSLSTWLQVGSEGTPKKSNSRNSSVSVGNSPSDRKSVLPNKFEDRPILGALTVEELRQMSAASTPRKSPSKSPDDMPIIGTVGSYWSHTGQTADSGGSSTRSTKSRYRESAEVIWDATPFEARLEKALEKEANAEQVLAI